jgi:hypothetical protein
LAVEFPAGVHDVVDEAGDDEKYDAEHSDDAPREGYAGGDGLGFIGAGGARGAATDASEGCGQASEEKEGEECRGGFHFFDAGLSRKSSPMSTMSF